MTHLTANKEKKWYCLGKASNIKKKQVVRLFGERVLLLRTKKMITALQDYCPHRHAPLSAGKIKDNCIQCPYHGWTFDFTGKCILIPGLKTKHEHYSKNVPTYPLRVSQGLLWICPFANENEPLEKPYQIPYWQDPNLITFELQTSYKGHFIDGIENLLDGTHTHFVHKGLVRKDKNRQSIRADVEVTSNTVTVSYTEEGKQNGLISKWFEKDRKSSQGKFILPNIAQLEYQGYHGLNFMLNAFVLPESEAEHKIIIYVTFPKIFWLPDLFVKFIFKRIIKHTMNQDLNILQMQYENKLALKEHIPYSYTPLDLIRPGLEAIFSSCSSSMKYSRIVNL